MTKIKIIFLFLLLSNKICSQTISFTKVADTIYVMFDETQKFDDLHLRTVKNKINMSYEYIYPDGKRLLFTAYLKGNVAKMNFCRKKSFLKKIAKKSVSPQEFKKQGYTNMLMLLAKKKSVIYIIDRKDYGKNTIKVKRGYLLNTIETNI